MVYLKSAAVRLTGFQASLPLLCSTHTNAACHTTQVDLYRGKQAESEKATMDRPDDRGLLTVCLERNMSQWKLTMSCQHSWRGTATQGVEQHQTHCSSIRTLQVGMPRPRALYSTLSVNAHLVTVRLLLKLDAPLPEA